MMMMMAKAGRRAFHWKDAFEREDVRRIWYVHSPLFVLPLFWSCTHARPSNPPTRFFCLGNSRIYT